MIPLEADNAPADSPAPPAYDPRVKQKAAAKLARIPIKVQAAEVLKKPSWIRVKAGSPSTRLGNGWALTHAIDDSTVPQPTRRRHERPVY